MGKYELSIAPNYVADWGIVEAVRELFQNALDQETISNDNKMFFEYDEESCVLSIGNKASVLEIKSLLFGSSTKSGDERTIGQFGEGYKLASLVLTRLEKTVTFYNYGKKEVWRPRFVNSRRYDSQILTFFTEKHIWSKVPHNNLVITVDNISAEEYELITDSNLHVGDPGPLFEATQGKILWDRAGEIFVNGLFVEFRDDLSYGYDMSPKYIKLDRDRKAVKDFDLRYLTGKMLLQVNDSRQEEVVEAIQTGKNDTEYMHYRRTEVQNDYRVVLKDKFVEEHGDKAVPVRYQHQIDEVKKQYPDAKPIVVTENEQNLIGDVNVENLTEVTEKSLKEKLEDWFEKLLETTELEDELVTEFNELLAEVK